MNNKVELVGWYGGDIAIARAAWTSTQNDVDLKTDNQIRDLIVNRLWNNGSGKPHKTPFERGIVEFNVTCDVASHIHLLKHRHTNINGECLDGDTMIYFQCPKTGNISRKISIRELYNKFNGGRIHQNTEQDKIYYRNRIRKMNVRVLDEITKKFTIGHIHDIWKTDMQSIYKITLKDGKTIMMSDRHPILTKSGYKSISDGLTIGDVVGCNGVNIEIPNRPHTFKSFFDGSEEYTRKEFAMVKNVAYELIKKWGYIFDVKFKIDTNKDFKKGNKSWNTGKSGTYKIDVGDRLHNPLKGDKCHFWRGGISNDRQLIGAWTTQQSPKVHKKFNYTCQQCGQYSTKLHAHHIIPVVQDLTKSMDFDNLISVCVDCHVNIHKSVESEVEFAEKVLNNKFIPKNNLTLKSSKYLHYVEIINIEFIKFDECYDIEISGEFKNFVANGIVTHNSARYRELKDDKFYLPDDWKVDGKWGWYDELKEFTEKSNELYHQCLSDLTPLLGRKRAKESARFFKTYNSQITLSVMTNMSCFHNFYTLRHDSSAQLEIREIAGQMLDCIKNIEGNPFKHTLEAFNF